MQVNLPDAQKILLRIDPTLPLHEIREQICKQKKYSHSNQYTLRLPDKLDQPLLLGLSLAEYKTNELTLVYTKEVEEKLNPNQHPSFDRLYRTRSESQPPKELIQELQHEQQLIHERQSYQSNANRPSHTSLHAYWNDPNFDTQSQVSNNSLMTKKRRAPRPPPQTSPNKTDPQIVYIHRQQPVIPSPSPPLRVDHHQSQESLQSENTKKKRKAPVVVGTTVVPKKDQIEQQNLPNSITRPGKYMVVILFFIKFSSGLEPPPPPAPATNTVSPVIDHLNEDHPSPDELDQKSPDDQCVTNADLVISINSSETTNSDTHSPEQVPNQSPTLPPTITQPPAETSEEVGYVFYFYPSVNGSLI